MNNSIRQLEAFVKVVENLSFSKAADALFLSQSTISSHVAQLERNLQATLLERSEKKRVRPTEDGMRVYHAALQILRRMEALETMFQRGEAQPLISIAASTIPARYILPSLLAAYSAVHPGHRFSVLEGDSAFALRSLEEGNAAFAFTGTKSRRAKLVHHALCQDRLVLLTPNTPELAKRKQEGALGRDLLDTPLLLREEGSGTRRETDLYLISMGIDPGRLQAAAYINDVETIKRMVVSGMGASILSERAAEDLAETGKALLFPLEEEGYCRTLYFVYPKDMHFFPAEESFFRFVKKYGLRLHNAAGKGPAGGNGTPLSSLAAASTEKVY